MNKLTILKVVYAVVDVDLLQTRRNPPSFSPGNLLGTWIPLTLIFLASFLTSLAVTKRASAKRTAA